MKKSTQQKILLVDCGDEKGLIHKISGILYGSKCNIISNREFVDRQKDRFYMRTEFEGEGIDTQSIQKELAKVLPRGANIRLSSKGKKKTIVMATKEHHCLVELLSQNFYSDLNMDIRAVVSNHDDLRGISEKFATPYHFVPSAGIGRGEHEKRIEEVLSDYDFEYIVLAKYMRVLSKDFVNRYSQKVINIHHSFLPAFAGANPYRQAYARGVKLIGATAHFVTEKLDEGPIISQDVVDINHTYGVDEIKKAGRDMESLVLTRALRLVSEDRLFVNGNKTIVF